MRGNLLWQRQLHEDAVNLWVGVKRIDLRDELVLRRRLGHFDDLGVDAECLARLVLIAHVDLRSGVRADDDDGKARLHAVLLEKRCGFLLRILAERLGKDLALQNTS